MRVGYACLALGLPGGEIKNCILKNASEERLLSLIGHNLSSLDKMIDYNIQHGIRLFRISSNLIPFGSSLAKDLRWHDSYEEIFASIGCKINNVGMRVSMHPGQYTVLNSPDESVADRAIQDLNYHAKVLDCLGLGREHKIILHLGGKYGNKEHAIKRFLSRYRQLSDNVKRRLVLENDDKLFNIADILETAYAEGIPVVFDNLHNTVNPADKSCNYAEWIKRCSETWTKENSPQKITYPAHQMYQMIEISLRKPIFSGNAANAAQHVWGYFKNKASESEKKRFESVLRKFELGKIEVQLVKNMLFTMARKYKEDYLLNSYYFHI